MKPPALLKQRELVVWFLINDLSKRFFSSVDKEMRSLGLTRAQWYVLTHVYYYEGLTQQELADRMDLTKSSAAKLIRKLEQKKWIVRKSDHRDGRVQRVHLIPSLRPVVQSLAKVARGALVIPLSHLSDPDTRELLRILQRLEVGFDADSGNSTRRVLEEAKRDAEKTFQRLRRTPTV